VHIFCSSIETSATLESVVLPYGISNDEQCLAKRPAVQQVHVVRVIKAFTALLACMFSLLEQRRQLQTC
jgi:hypothetical protein